MGSCVPDALCYTLEYTQSVHYYAPHRSVLIPPPAASVESLEQHQRAPREQHHQHDAVEHVLIDVPGRSVPRQPGPGSRFLGFSVQGWNLGLRA